MATEQVEESVVEQLKAEEKPSVVAGTEQQPQRHSFFRTRTSTATSIATDAPTTTTTGTTEASTTRRTVFRNRGSSTARPNTTTSTTTPTTTSAKAEEGEREADDVVVPTPLPKRRVIVRGNYRPRKEGDLSSLLAVDGNKRVRYNHQPDPISPGEGLQVSKTSQEVEVTSEAAVDAEEIEQANKVTKSEESANRVKVNSRAPLAAIRNRTSSQTETLGNGITRTRTTYVRTLDEGKVVKRVHTKTIQEKPAEYEYVYHEINEPAASTTPRVITRNRGSVRFQSNDLSSLLALDFASRAQRNKQTQSTVTRTRTRVLKKPKETLEHEEVEEFVYDAANDVQQEDADDEVPALSRSSTEAPVRQQIRTRRPTATTTRTTTARSTTTRPTSSTTTEQSVGLEQEVSTRRTSFRARRPTARATTTTTTTTTTESANVELPTRRVITIKRPIATTTSSTTTTTTEKPEEPQEPSTEIQPTTARNFIKHLTANKTTTTTTTEATTKEGTTTTEAIPSATSPELTDDLSDLKVQFTNALHSLQSDSQTKVEASTTEDDLKQASSGERLSLPIYHRRKYFQYVKDSPITYIDKAPAPAEGGTPTVDIEKQIHDVFNVSDNGTPSNALDDGDVDSAEADHRMAMEQAKEINSELSHFLLNTPGSV